MANAINWVTCDGGPLLLLPRHLEQVWRGSLPLEDGRSVDAKCRWSGEADSPATDYDLACDITDPVGIIEVAGAQALVFATEDSMGTWLPSSEFPGGILVVHRSGPKMADPAAALLAAVASVPKASFSDAGLTLNFADGVGLLCAACDAGPNWLYKPQPISIPPGRYVICTADIEVDGFSLCLHGLSPV